jgi:hypothetical protein
MHELFQSVVDNQTTVAVDNSFEISRRPASEINVIFQ